MFKNINIPLDGEEAVNTSGSSHQYEERQNSTPIPVQNNDSNVGHDYCSDDSVKDPDYEAEHISDSSSCSAGIHYKPSQLRPQKVTKTIQDYNQSQQIIPSTVTPTATISAMANESNPVEGIELSSFNLGTSMPETSPSRSFRRSSTSSNSSTSSGSSTSSSSSSSSSGSEVEHQTRPPLRDVSDSIPSSSVSMQNTHTNLAISDEVPVPDESANTNPIFVQNSNFTPEKKTRKRKANPEKWACVQAKILRNSGKSYISKSKKIIPERCVKQACTEKCKQKCTVKISDSERKEVFNSYWALNDLQRQREFIIRHMTPIKPRYSYKVHDSKRENNFAFYLTIKSERVRVCKLFFKCTLDISDRVIKTVVQKTTITGTLESDNRGKHQNHQSIDPIVKEGVRQHLDSIPRIDSHYCRADTDREYIDGGKTIADLHRDYVNDCESNGITDHAKYSMYYNIFMYENNLSFFQPKKDQCEDCTAFSNASEEEKAELKESYDLHLKEKDLAREGRENDIKYSPDNCIVSVFDLQATLPCPKGDVSNFYCVSKLNCFNFTVCDLKTKNVDCFVWHEGEGKRGSIEIGSCLLKYLESFEDSAKKLDSKLDFIFYSDNCCGQQKNHFIFGPYIYAVYHLDFVNSISHKFLIKGHTQNSADNAHSVIERKIKLSLKSRPIYTPDQYIHIIRNAKVSDPPYKVHELTFEDFTDIKALADLIGKNYSKNTENNNVKLTDIKIIKVDSNDTTQYSYKYMTSYEDVQFKKVIVEKIGKTRNTNNRNNIKLKKVYKKKFQLMRKRKKDY